MRLAQFITASSEQIIAEWEVFARSCTPAASAMDLSQRRDHAAGMLKAIALDLDTPQTKQAQTAKSKGTSDADVDSASAANSHGTERAATGYTPVQMVSEFRALRASILRLWSESQTEFTRVKFEDVTRFNEAIDQNLAESLARYVADVERSKDLFLGVLGHDLRNPLGAMMMSATLMMTLEGPDWVHSKTASRIVTSGTRMNEMIGDLLDFTRMRLGAGISLVREDVDLEATCRHVVDEITAFHPRFTVNVETSGQLRGRWDSGRIAQVLSNLVGNAYQHGAADQPVQVAVRGEPEQVVITVTNQGGGIATQHLKDIFNPFRQLDAVRATTGDLSSLGLGLYIARAIVTAHEGTIDVDSTTRGTTFMVRLPRTTGSSLPAS